MVMLFTTRFMVISYGWLYYDRNTDRCTCCIGILQQCIKQESKKMCNIANQVIYKSYKYDRVI